ncbi:MAG: septum formation inhibitor Maf, partial [Acidobacteriota bacterium]|nr:septum formation inhibitor Maf [Acidobacteriota bacterium]
MVILASASPRRRELLTQAGVVFAVESADVDESLLEGEQPAQYVERLAVEKAQAVFARHSEQPGLKVLGADTTVVCQGQVLGKPTDAADARRMLLHLSGRTHQVLTGVAVVSAAGVASDVVVTQVFFDQILPAELDHYIASGEPLDKAGAYGIQGYAARWIPRIEGCYYNV